jgi:hypothetical protein
MLSEIVRGERSLPHADAVRASVSRFTARRVVESMASAFEIERAGRVGSHANEIVE